LLASAMVQAVLYLLTTEQFHYGGPVKKALIKEYEKEMGARQLWGCLRPPHSIMLDHQIYDDANIEQPKIWCHVWVQKREAKEQRTSKMGKGVSEKTADQGTHEEEIIPDCDEGEEHTGMDATDVKKLHEARRSTWEKSTLPIQVQLRPPPAEEKKLIRWIWGLFRDEYGPPVLCIVIPKEDFQDLDQQQDFEEVKKRHDKEKRPMKCQLVPRQFLAGGASVWLNLGRKNLWEKLTGALPFGAFLLTVVQTVYTKFRSANMIQTCDDIRNADCSFFDNTQEHPVDFRLAMGFKVAILGGAFALAACFCLRVSYSIDNSSEERSCWRSCWRYMEAVGFHITMLCKLFFCWPCKFICQRHGTTSKGDIKKLDGESLRQLLL